jgi:catechol 2,3-dioxygenase-like lactoylglutathione lyase family enzyme
MKIYITSIFVDDQAKALDFYTTKLGFEKKTDIPLGQYRWLTVVPAGEQGGVELLLEPTEHPAVKPFRKALVDDGIPCTSFEVTDIEKA